jgi:hypothetical protein
MAHLITDSKFPQSAPSPAPSSSTYTATTILTITVYSRKISDGVTAVTHGPLSKLTKHPVTAVSTADSVVVEGGSDIDPDDAKAEEMEKFLHYIGIHDEANRSTRETVDNKARCTSRGVRYIHKFHNFPDHPFWDWDGNRTPKKDECGRRIVRWGELSSERKFRLQREFIHRRVTHLGLLIMALVVVIGFCWIAWIWRRQWRLVTTRRWEEMKIVYHGHARPLFDNARASLRAWFTAKREIIEYELRDWEERSAQYTEIGATVEHINDSQRTFVGHQANSETGFAAAPVEGDNDDDKSSQELLDELASEEDWMEEPNTSNPMRRLGSVIRGVFRQADNVETPAESHIYEAVTLFDIDEVEEEFNLHHPTSHNSPRSNRQDDLIDMEDEADGEGDFLLSSSIYSTDSEKTLVNSPETEEDFIFQRMSRQGDIIDIDDETSEEDDSLLRSSIHSTDSEETLVNSDEISEENDFSMRSSLTSIDSQATLVGTYDSFQEYDPLWLTPTTSIDSEATLVNTYESDGESDRISVLSVGTLVNTDEDNDEENLLRDFILRTEREQRLRNWQEWLHYYGDSD